MPTRAEVWGEPLMTSHCPSCSPSPKVTDLFRASPVTACVPLSVCRLGGRDHSCAGRVSARLGQAPGVVCACRGHYLLLRIPGHPDFCEYHTPALRSLSQGLYDFGIISEEPVLGQQNPTRTRSLASMLCGPKEEGGRCCENVTRGQTSCPAASVCRIRAW